MWYGCLIHNINLAVISKSLIGLFSQLSTWLTTHENYTAICLSVHGQQSVGQFVVSVSR